MSVQKIPLFQRGNILTQEMMESMKNYMVDYTVLKYGGYSDGILRGCHVTADEDILSVRTGILIVAGKPFLIGETIEIPYAPTNTVKILAAHIGEKEISRSFENQNVEFILTDEDKTGSADIELCRFRLQQGAKLRYVYRDFADMNTEYDTICLGHAKWAAFGGESLSYEILAQFAKEALNAGARTPEDNQFVGQILASGGETLTASCINSYIAERLGRPYADGKRTELYQGLLEILQEMGKGKRTKPAVGRRERRIIVD